MKKDESIYEMRTRFTSIINELHSLGEIIPTNKLVRKILVVLPSSWESKVNAITEAKDLQTLTIDALIGYLKTYEMKRKNDLERRESKKEKNLVLKAAKNDTCCDESKMAYLTRRFHKKIRRNGGIPKRGSSSRNFKGNDCCHKCGKSGNFIKECPLHSRITTRILISLINEKNVLNEEFDGLEQIRDDLVVTVVDLNEQVEEAGVRGGSKKWYMDSGCSKHMTKRMKFVLSLKAFQHGSVYASKNAKTLCHTIEKFYYVNGLTYSMLYGSQICDKGNEVVDFGSLDGGNLKCSSDVHDDAELWHK
ncbi:uncharacterized protein LOC132613093 [Lycium barbarum]|uniref:uncharacterized protein LOC132613093 n=1 Tax=Lycium barbarum TaxID=112863 RepID=UPI00293E9E1D|nr:uncharacterized protein LOC132613093 [Lycium barbarum]